MCQSRILLYSHFHQLLPLFLSKLTLHHICSVPVTATIIANAFAKSHLDFRGVSDDTTIRCNVVALGMVTGDNGDEGVKHY